MTRSQTPSWADIFQSAFDARFARFWTAAPGIVQGYDAGSQRATVQPVPSGSFIDEAGVRRTEPLPQLGDVPVVFGAMTHPIDAGDTVLLIFLSCSRDVFLTGGTIVDTPDDRRNSLTDAVCIPFLRTAVSQRDDVPEDAVVLWGDDIRLGGPDDVESVTRTVDIRAAFRNAVSDAGIAGAIKNVGLGVPDPASAQAALVLAVNTYFDAHPVQGSSVVKAVA